MLLIWVGHVVVVVFFFFGLLVTRERVLLYDTKIYSTKLYELMRSVKISEFDKIMRGLAEILRNVLEKLFYLISVKYSSRAVHLFSHGF